MEIVITGKNSFVGNYFISKYHTLNINEIDLLSQKPDEFSLSGISSVIHLAALVHQMQGAPEKKYFEINSDLAFNIAKKAKDEGVSHFLFMSTVKVYGEYTEKGYPWTEEFDCSPTDPYGKSKLEGEQRIKALEDNNFKVSVIRTPLVYGPGVRANMYNLMKMINRYPVVPFGNINNKRSLTFVGNLCQLLHNIIEQKKSGIFLACDGEPVSTSVLVKQISIASLKKHNIIAIPGIMQKSVKLLKPEIHRRIFGNLEVDNTETCNMLGYIPEYSFESGIKEMVEWYKSSIK